MSVLQGVIFITFDINTKETEFIRNDNITDYDTNTTNIYVQSKYKKSDGETVYLSSSEIANYGFTLYTMKPLTNEVNEINGAITNELIEQVRGGVIKFVIPKACTNRHGVVKCELHINKEKEMIASTRFILDVKQSLVTKFNDSLLDDEDFPVLQQLILDIQKTNNINDSNRSKITTFSSDKIENIRENLISKINNSATKQEVDVERKRIDTFTSLAQGSTTGDAELIDARIGSDNYVYPNLGTSLREQIKGLQNQLNLNFHNIYNKHNNSNFYYNKDGSTTQTNGSHQITEKYTINNSTNYFYAGINNPKTFIYTHFFDNNDKSVGYLLLETGFNKLTIPAGASKVAFSIAREDIDSFLFIQDGYILDNLFQCIKSKGIIDDSSELYKDFNDVPINSIITYNCNNQVNNSPISITKGCLLTIHGREKFNGGVTQLFISNLGDFYYRIYFSDAFTSWKKIVDEDRCNTIVEHRCNSIVKENIDNSYNFISLFENIGIIGDSWASGFTYPDGISTNNYSISWGQIMARKNGVNVTNFSKGALSTKTWLDDAKGDALLQSEEAKNLYLIALGINDATAIDNGDMSLGSISDINTNNYNNNANTFYGYYGKIVSKIKEKAPNGKIILITIPRTDKTTYATLNEAIINIANLFNIPYIVSLDKSLFTSDLFNNTKVNAHPTAVGYSAMADAYTKLITECIINNYEYFIDYYGN